MEIHRILETRTHTALLEKLVGSYMDSIQTRNGEKLRWSKFTNEGLKNFRETYWKTCGEVLQ